MTGIDPSITSKIINGKYKGPAKKITIKIIETIGKPIEEYAMGDYIMDNTYQSVVMDISKLDDSIEEIDRRIARLQELKKEIITRKLELLHNETSVYENLLKEIES